ncbi:MAG: RluA family pseudouridine synthase [Acutalibacteraceae bacterium]|nr:RluA family pseudouridine synthase [Acutalibacteraceae bacterium]
MDIYNFEIDNDSTGIRLDKYLSEKINDITRSALQGYFLDGNITVNGIVVNKNYKTKINDNIQVSIPEPVPLEAVAENIPLNIIYEDDDVIVVNKAKGMVVHPAAGNYTGTLVNALLYHCKDSLSGINGVLRPGIVHRIDKNTSGLLIVAKNDITHKGLAQQIKEHSFTRQYETIVYGNIKENSGTVNQPIGRNPNDRKKMTVIATNSKEAVTHFNVVERFNEFTHLAVTLETGRTHQIRVHMAYINHPVVGDDVYGPKKVITKLSGQCLHARKIGFIHPITGKYLEFTSDLPEYFTNFLTELRQKYYK